MTQSLQWKYGLCATCANVQEIPHPRGGEPYLRCGLHDSDKRYPKFPPLPVRECCGYAPRDDKV